MFFDIILTLYQALVGSSNIILLKPCSDITISLSLNGVLARPWFNIKMSSYQYRKSHCGDKTILRPSYLHNGISCTGKMTCLYWIGIGIPQYRKSHWTILRPSYLHNGISYTGKMTSLYWIGGSGHKPEAIKSYPKYVFTELSHYYYRQVSNISRTLVGNKIVDHSDVVGASPVGAAPTTSSFSTEHMASLDWAKTTTRRDEKHLGLGIWCALY